jgi:predicted nucleic acid-binding protein
VSGRVVIADAGPLIGLARIDALRLLRDLFGQVCHGHGAG